MAERASGLFDGCDFGPTAERVLWELDGALLRTTGEACETATFSYVDNRVSDVRTLDETVLESGCTFVATITTTLVFQSADQYAGTIEILGEYGGVCSGMCESSFDVSATRCAEPAPCTPAC